MNADVQALLALQVDDARINEIQAKVNALDPRMADLDRRRELAANVLTRARAGVETEEKRQRELQLRIDQHKQLHERNVHQLDSVKRLKEATAAVAQVDAARRMIADEESEQQTISRRLSEMRASIETYAKALEEVEREQATAREEIEAERASLVSELEAAREVRTGKTQGLDRSLLGKYDRIRSKRSSALHPLRGGSCGNCDTSIPLQRRNAMAGEGEIQVCEACGVLLYREGDA